MKIDMNDKLIIETAEVSNRGQYYCWVDYELVSYYQVEGLGQEVARFVRISDICLVPFNQTVLRRNQENHVILKIRNKAYSHNWVPNFSRIIFMLL